ncbi:hypothetical protein I3W98_16325, partial [Streptomyces cavourensis]|nr:hypothetical protein [Streptomyces cavourensis]
MTSLNGHGLRFAFGTLTVLPVRVTQWDRATARSGMLCAPLAGLVVGLLAAALGRAEGDSVQPVGVDTGLCP